ncbi:MAG: hypothetical protein A2Y02_01030 [Omnitrophica bacterium GWA2_52_12]|nr:MAG: hypothetical protein A2Y02_01030 [Omnitrophica bacterium GWA2_52_12]
MKIKLSVFVLFGALLFLSAGRLEAADGLCAMHDGKKADGKSVLEQGGKKHEFCCSGCLQKFKEAPESFTRELKPEAPVNDSSAEAACSSVCSE